MTKRATQPSGLFESLVVDLFAGGGGASIGIEEAFLEAGHNRPVDIAINHSPTAIACHRANHPHTWHYCQDIFEVDPVKATGGRPVGLLWASPDCTHFSKAKGGKPRDHQSRSLAWVVHRWASAVRPAVIILENVEEFQDWGPLTRERLPDKTRLGETFTYWVNHLRNGLGYDVEWRQLRACDYGAPTIRRRLFLVARCDGRPIVWPEPTHADPRDAARLGLKPWRSAAECIDWSIPCPSIFLTPEQARAVGVRRPLADNTLRRIANGIRRYVIDAAEPFIVQVNHSGDERRGQPVSEPLRTVTASRRSHALVAPSIVPYYGPKSDHDGRSHTLCNPLRTQTTENRFGLVSAFLTKHYTGVVGDSLENPVPTITGTDHNALTAAHLVKLRGTCKDGQSMQEPMPTVTAGGTHIGEVRAFLVKYYGTANGQSLREPMHTVTSKHRLGLVTVAGEDYQIVDIGMRMLTPAELAQAQDFPEDYRLNVAMNGKPMSKAAQVQLIGNSVCRCLARALVKANYVDVMELDEVVAA